MRKYMKALLTVAVLALTLCIALTACDNGNKTTDTSADTTTPADTQSAEIVTNEDGEVETQDPSADTTPLEIVTTADGEVVTQAPSTSDTQAGGSTAEPVEITLTFNGLSCDPSVAGAVEVNAAERAFVITKAGTYVLTGDLTGGQVRVAVPKTDDVTLIFKNFNATNPTNSPLYIQSANKCVIELAPGTVNTLTDSDAYVFADPTQTKPNACIYSSDDLTIKGDGTLNVIGNWNNGIGCKNDLRIKSGTINVSAPNNIIKGNDSVSIEGGKITLSGGEDAIKSDATDRTDKGFVLIEGDAQLTITCADDAIQASNSVTVAAGTSVTVTAGGNAINCLGTINADETAMNVISEGAAEADTAA